MPNGSNINPATNETTLKSAWMLQDCLGFGEEEATSAPNNAGGLTSLCRQARLLTSPVGPYPAVCLDSYFEDFA